MYTEVATCHSLLVEKTQKEEEKKLWTLNQPLEQIFFEDCIFQEDKFKHFGHRVAHNTLA
jgi:hypothetical protein